MTDDDSDDVEIPEIPLRVEEEVLKLMAVLEVKLEGDGNHVQCTQDAIHRLVTEGYCDVDSMVYAPHGYASSRGGGDVDD